MERNRRSKNRFLPLVIFVVFVSIIASVQIARPYFLPALFSSFASPLWRAEFAIKSGSLLSREELLSENESLKRSILEMKVKSASFQNIVNENNALKTILGRFDRDDLVSTSSLVSEMVLSPVLSEPPALPYDELIIDGGNDLGFKKGDKVYASFDVLVGTISQVLKNTSKVTLYSSPGQSLEVLVGSTSAKAVAYGRGGGQFEIELSRSVILHVGDFINVPSISNVPFGIVKAVENDPALPFQKVLFAPPANVFELRWVLVKKTEV